MGSHGDAKEKWYYSFLPYNISGGSTSPLIPLFVTNGLKGTVADVGLITAVTSMAAVPANIIWGNLSDTLHRRKPFILMGFVGMAMALVMMGLSTNVPSYLIANFLFGLLGAAIAPVGTVLVLESFEKKEWPRRLGDFSKIGGIGWVLGLVLGTLWLLFLPSSNNDVTSTRALFLLAAGLSLASLILAVWWIKEPKVKVERDCVTAEDIGHVQVSFVEKARYMPQRVLFVAKVSARNLQAHNFPSNLRRYYLMIFLAFSGFLSFYVALPVFLSSQEGLTDPEVFIVYLASSIASALTYSMMGRIISAKGGKKVQMAAFAARIFIFPAFFLVTLLHTSFAVLFILFMILHALAGLCWAGLSVAGNALVSQMSFRNYRSQSLGMYNAVQGIGTIAGSIIGGLVGAAFGYMAVFLCASCFIAVALVLLITMNVEAPKEDGPDACPSS
jgi:MFS family permease